VFEPEKGNTGENFAFVRDWVIHHHIKGRHAIAGNNQQFIIDLVHIPNLTSFDELEILKMGL
jgi:hypothetical protein